jgi:hypothetical protein
MGADIIKEFYVNNWEKVSEQTFYYSFFSWQVLLIDVGCFLIVRPRPDKRSSCIQYHIASGLFQRITLLE